MPRMYSGREDSDFFHGWTTFYWAWWVAWSLFVGMFIARVSKGRMAREFIAGGKPDAPPAQQVLQRGL